MSRMFGTDGVRGIANRELTAELAFRLGQAGAKVLQTARKPRILVGQDTRLSGDMLAAALTAGICSMGAEAVLVGVLPTPGIAYLTRHYQADAGVVISASHNPMEFNGIKFFNGQGYKLRDELEDEIQRIVESGDLGELPTGADVGRRVRMRNAQEDYVEFLVSSCREDLSGLYIVLDCANGAASWVAPEVFRRLGARVDVYYDQPDGTNINDLCGSTHPQALQRLVMESGADLGLAFDGDADRMLAVDENGLLIDGDRIMAVCGLDMKERGELAGDTIVGTVMSNLGLHIALEQRGIKLETTKVGDRYVLERMLEAHYKIGGEQSGHVIFLDYNTTGDGVLSGLMLCQVMVRKGAKLSTLASVMRPLPQVLVNVDVSPRQREAYPGDPELAGLIAEVEAQLGNRGRVLIRPSGTEPKVRVMIEGEDQGQIEAFAQRIAEKILAL